MRCSCKFGHGHVFFVCFPVVAFAEVIFWRSSSYATTPKACKRVLKLVLLANSCQHINIIVTIRDHVEVSIRGSSSYNPKKIILGELKLCYNPRCLQRSPAVAAISVQLLLLLLNCSLGVSMRSRHATT